MAPLACIISPDPEVSGIGIRISLHITILLASFIPNLFGWIPSFELRSALLASATLNAFSLLLIGIIKTVSRELSLFHAIFIIHNICVLAIATNFVRGRSTRMGFGKVGLYWMLTWAALGAFFGWSIFVLVKAPYFGSQPECNSSIVYVIWFRNVNPTRTWVRWLVISVMGLYAIRTIAIPFGATILRCLRRVKYTGSEPTDHYPTRNFILPASTAPTATSSAWKTIFGIRGSAADTGGEVTEQTGLLRALPVRPVDLYGTHNVSELQMFIQPCAAIYGTVMLELFMKRNSIGPGEDKWTSGQIVILLPVALGVVNEFVRVLLSAVGIGTR